MNEVKLLKFSLSILIVMFFGGCKNQKTQTATETINIPSGYKLVWQDEFDSGEEPNPEFWSDEYGFVRNSELQWYQEDNTLVNNGLLSITGRQEEVKNPQYDSASDSWKKNRKVAEYTSSSINTRGKFDFKYGILEVRAKIDTSSGMWPAIWTLGVDRDWPSNGEIDMMEYYQIDGKPHILANAAWGDNWQNVSWDSTQIPFTEFLKKDAQWSKKFHIWKMEWTPQFIKLYLDDALLNEIDLAKTQNPDGFNGFHQRHYMLLNLAIGSNGGDPSQTPFPKNYQVDYVRVFQKSDQNL